MTFANPLILFSGLALVALYFFSQQKNHEKPAAITFSSLTVLKKHSAAQHRNRRSWPDILALIGLILCIIALARPQLYLNKTRVQKDGIDILLCIDTSLSMKAEDLIPNRLKAAMKVSKEFIQHRPNDRIGLVVYGAVAYTLCPPTLDHQSLATILDSLSFDMTGHQGTAIGSALATSVNRLKDLEGDSKVIILLTDGRSNSGEITPEAAAQIAKDEGITVYSIGIGKVGAAPITVTLPGGALMQRHLEVDIDEPTLQRIANITSGQYNRAYDNNSLAKVYEKIDLLETTSREEEVQVNYRDIYAPFLTLGLLLYLASLFLHWTNWEEYP